MINNQKNNSIGKRILEARKEKDISLFVLSEKTGISKSTLQRYETGTTRKIPLEALRKIEQALKLENGSIIDTGREKTPLKSPNITTDVTSFAVIGEIAAGYDNVAIEDWTGETVEIPNSYLSGRKKEEFIVLKVKGDSMYPLYHDGDKVLILKQSTLNRSGDIGAVLYNDELVTIKKVEYAPGEDWLDLVPVNPEYKPQHIQGEALAHCSVIGIPKLLIREF